MIDRFEVEKYLGEGWKEFRDGEQWSDVGVFMELIRKDDKLSDQFINFAYAFFKGFGEEFGENFIFWLFTPKRFCKLVIEFLEEEKLNEQAKTS